MRLINEDHGSAAAFARDLLNPLTKELNILIYELHRDRKEVTAIRVEVRHDGLEDAQLWGCQYAVPFQGLAEALGVAHLIPQQGIRTQHQGGTDDAGVVQAQRC